MPDMKVQTTKRKRAVPHDGTTEAGSQEEELDGREEDADNDEEEEAMPAKRFRSSFTDTITVLVGEEKVPFTIHTKTVRAKSKFFDAACQREWNEGRERVVKLPEVDPETFELYATWMYQDKIDHEALRMAAFVLDSGITTLSGEQHVKFCWTSTLDLMRLHVAADFLGDAELMKQAVDGITEIITASGPFAYKLQGIVSYVWGSTSSKSGLRKIVLDYIVAAGMHKSMRNHLREIQSNVPSDFFADLSLHTLKAFSHLDAAFEPLPARKYRYYEGYEPEKSVETAQHDT
ncbi:hypothetical protein LTR56_011410 [Elasticomyces elasticus]|nr:hypothetical protein LTR56_011410 [Elasticomyces elasticus]KAK3655996.1 hypothetical protein LTR22_010005 [Elasticomyces elasticus]KAK4921495.1 hypothetical protein LTR49_011149 [Elasticomyces elasticus]KAK5760034.1 hypothetical protein LTS12_009765 [Elasticomyces elasticus]